MSHKCPFGNIFRSVLSSEETETILLDYEVEENLDDFGVGPSTKNPADADSKSAQLVVIEELCREIINIEPGGLLDQYC